MSADRPIHDFTITADGDYPLEFPHSVADYTITGTGTFGASGTVKIQTDDFSDLLGQSYVALFDEVLRKGAGAAHNINVLGSSGMALRIRTYRS